MGTVLLWHGSLVIVPLTGGWRMIRRCLSGVGLAAIWRPLLALRMWSHRGPYIGGLLTLLLTMIGVCLAGKAMVGLKVGHCVFERGIEAERDGFALVDECWS
jgi:hypothetical protein